MANAMWEDITVVLARIAGSMIGNLNPLRMNIVHARKSKEGEE